MNFVIENNILRSTKTFVYPENNLGQLIYDVINESPHHVSQIDAKTGKQTSHADMKNYSVRCASWMRKQGMRPDDIVVVITGYHADAYIPVLATFFLDAVFSGWNENISLNTARRLLKQFAPKIIFTSQKAAGVLMEALKLENLRIKLVVFESFPTLQSLSDILYNQCQDVIDNFRPSNEKSPEELTAIMLSSGTTGFPKGVMLSSKALLFRSLQPRFVSSVPLKFLHYSTLCWISGLHFTLHSIFLKHTRIIPDCCNIDNCFEMIEKYKISFLYLLPTVLNTLSKSTGSAKKYDIQSLKCILFGGSIMSKQTLETLKQQYPNVEFKQVYGATESTQVIEVNDKTESIDSIGFINTNCEAKFVDTTTETSVGPNQYGEIRVKTPALMLGYYKNTDATREAFDKEGWFRTGDIGFYNEIGEAFVVGRIKEIMKYRGYQVSPAEIEEVLFTHSEVQEAAVIGVSHDIDVDWPAAFVVKTAESKLTEKELMEYTSSILEDYKRLRGGIYFLDKLPRTGSGKVAKIELKNLAEKLVITNNST